MENQLEFKKLIEQAYHVSRDVGVLVENAFEDAAKSPMGKEEVEIFLLSVIGKIQKASDDQDPVHRITANEANTIITQIMEVRQNVIEHVKGSQEAKKIVSLSAFNGKGPGPVHPTPMFHRKEITMNCGGVKTTDISLWEDNERLDIHVGHFKAVHGRKPNSAELLDIMLSKMPLEGLGKKDQFKIEELAISIANNGVRKPPIIDVDGTLLDGNRRVAACYFILNSDIFASEQKKRAENIFVWQLTEHATDDDKNAVVISLNFEPDSKQDWSEYVKAKIIYDYWRAMLALEISPGPARILRLKKDLSLRFGYGGDIKVVTRYIKMVDMSNEFEEYLIEEKNHDEFQVKHQANEYFQYFDELSKNAIVTVLSQNEPLKHLVFELLFQGKFINWTLIRSLRYVNDDVEDALMKARDLDNLEKAQDLVEDKLNEAKSQTREARIGNPNQRIEIFTKWLGQLPLSAFQDSSIDPDNLQKLLDVLRLVEKQISDLK
jgi:hypothetical protein